MYHFKKRTREIRAHESLIMSPLIAKNKVKKNPTRLIDIKLSILNPC